MMARERLVPTVTLGGAPAGYKPATTLQPTVTLGGAPAGYKPVATESVVETFSMPATGASVAEDYRLNQITMPSNTMGSVGRTITNTVVNDDGSVTVIYSDGTKETKGGPNASQRQDDSGRQSAYDLLLSQFKQYGLEALVTPLKGLIADPSISESEFTLKLRDTDAYKTRFAANAARIGKGLRALNEADYIALEDQYQNVMRNYGLPATYYTKGDLGRQESLEKFIANDVSAAELEDRIITAQDRVLKANPEVAYALKNFYPDITNGDILAYALDPKQAITDIKRKVTAAEIGGAALSQGLTTSAVGAEELLKYGVTKEQAQQGFQTVAAIAPRGSQLADIYKQTPYTQSTAEAEVFGTMGAADARKQREKIISLEKAAFSGSSGAAKGALERERVNGAGAI